MTALNEHLMAGVGCRSSAGGATSYWWPSGLAWSRVISEKQGYLLPPVL